MSTPLAHQAGWVERDERGEILCVTNMVKLVKPSSVWLLWGGQDSSEQKSQDRAERSEWCLPLDLSVTFQRSERPEIEAFEKEHAAFEELLPSLMTKYRGRFVAIHNGALVDSDPSRSNLVRRFFERFGDASVYVGYVGEAPISYQVTPFQL